MTFFLQLLFEAALTVAGFFLLWFLLRARIRRFLELDKLLEGVRDEARALVIELNESADRSVSLVEDRSAALRELLDEVDRRMGLAKRELEKRAVEREVYTKLAQRRPIVPRDVDAPLQASLREPRRAAGSAATPAAAPAAIPAATPTAAPAAILGREGPIPLTLRPETLRVAEEGRSDSSSTDRPRDAERPRGAAQPRDAEPVSALESERILERRRGPELRVSEENLAPGPSLREQAVGLYRKGFSADIIAARLGATVAEIELLVEIEERRSGV
ncbi:MAG TPA: hypothetical protein VMV90_01415 [Rectinemataceae bacterium]|nr:hypothetical protein [Rectinemataceae bacterium]